MCSDPIVLIQKNYDSLFERSDHIEHQLAHAVGDPNGRAYNRIVHLPERRKMMQDWADYLDKIKLALKLS